MREKIRFGEVNVYAAVTPIRSPSIVMKSGSS